MAAMETKNNVTDEQAMHQVMGLLDEWQVPEPSPWFDARMMARFREEQQRAPQGWFARLRNRFVLGDAISMKPVLAGAMALLLVAGGGGYVQLQHMHQQAPAATSATVQDLQILDNNDQAIQQMDQLLDSDDSSHGDSL